MTDTGLRRRLASIARQLVRAQEQLSHIAIETSARDAANGKRRVKKPKRVKPPHEILGVRADAGQQAIKAAHRRLSKKLHPDVNRTKSAARKFREATDAKNFLLKGRD